MAEQAADGDAESNKRKLSRSAKCRRRTKRKVAALEAQLAETKGENQRVELVSLTTPRPFPVPSPATPAPKAPLSPAISKAIPSKAGSTLSKSPSSATVAGHLSSSVNASAVTATQGG